MGKQTMSQKPTPQEMAERARIALHSGEKLGAAELRRELIAGQKALTGRYEALLQHGPQSQAEEWLFDNYHTIQAQSSQAVRDLKGFYKKGQGDFPLVYHLLRQCFGASLTPVEEALLEAVLSGVDAHRPLTVAELDFLPTALRCVYLSLVFGAFSHPTQAAEIMAYGVVGLGTLSALPFEELIASTSSLERLLRQDPSGDYPNMTVATRRHYRQLCAVIAKAEGKSQLEVAEEALRQAGEEGAEGPRTHVGHFLTHHPAVLGAPRKMGRVFLYSSALVPAALAAALGVYSRSLWMGLLAYLPLWELCRFFLERGLLFGVAPGHIPQMDLERLAESCGSLPATGVVISTLVPKRSELPRWEEKLQQLYHANGEENLYYGLLCDLRESPYPTSPEDGEYIRALAQMVEGMNRRYQNRFFLVVRSRSFSPTQDSYSGAERKRGAITQLVNFISGEEVPFHTFVGSREVVRSFRYLLVLDGDTNLLFEAAGRMLSAALHPLNRPEVDESLGRVVEGYGILVPRMATELCSARATTFSRVMEGSGGVAGYDTKPRELYQDLFGESIFTGKGLIDVAVFHRLLSEGLPPNQILSHDILEGAVLRAGYLAEVELTDSAPATPTAWLSRLHRWMRGDWQNILFLRKRFELEGRGYENRLSDLSRYQLFDNLRRSLTPAAEALAIVAGVFLGEREAGLLCLTVLLAILLPSVWSSIALALEGGGFFFARRYFTDTLPRVAELLGQALFRLILLVQQALEGLDAMARSLYRTYHSRKNLLQWQPAGEGEGQGGGWQQLLKRYGLAEALGLCLLLFGRHWPLRFYGVCFAMLLPMVVLSSRRIPTPQPQLTTGQADRLLAYNAAMWRYYEDTVTAENNFLPPDNVQMAPVYGVAQRTSPTNIGMYLLSALAARDMGFIDSQGLLLRLERTLATVERLEKFRGNLYNWYDTRTLELLPSYFVSTVDSGNLLCSLVALGEGVQDYAAEAPGLLPLARRIAGLVDGADLGFFYSHKRNLFTIGYDTEEEALSGSHYDFLMSEARMTSYLALAKKQVPRRHWGAMNRTLSRLGPYAGPVSWTGTMFEYFMPHLLLPAHQGSLLDEALSYCLYCQRQRTRGLGLPWGVSESGYFAFDNGLSYQYKAHGVQRLGVKQHLNRELVISPYSTFLTLAFAPKAAMKNLAALEELGITGRYGFFEAVDFTPCRLDGGKMDVVRSYMAHHIGMSMIASCNALYQNRMQRRFMRDKEMSSAMEFLEERLNKDTAIYHRAEQKERASRQPQAGGIDEEYTQIFPDHPQAGLLYNGEMGQLLTDVGAGFLSLGALDVTRRSTDLLRRPQGIFCLVREWGKTFSATKAPYYDPEVAYSVQFQGRAVTYTAGWGKLSSQLRFLLHPARSCQQVQLTLSSSDAQAHSPSVLFYLEPVLAPYGDYSAHPAFSKLFVTTHYDPESRTVTFGRRTRGGEVACHLTVGLLEEQEFEYCLKKEDLMPAPKGLWGLREFDDLDFRAGAGTPDAVCALRLGLRLPPMGKAQATLLLATAATAEEGIRQVVAIRRLGRLSVQQAALSPVMGDTLVSRLAFSLLPQLIFPKRDSREKDLRLHLDAVAANTLGQRGLWGLGISGDLPIVLLIFEGAIEAQRLEAYLAAQLLLRRSGHPFDLCIFYEEAHAPGGLEAILQVAETTGSQDLIRQRGGVFPVETSCTNPQVLRLIQAVARHISSRAIGTMGVLGQEYQPMILHPVEPRQTWQPGEDILAVGGGSFIQGGFGVEKTSPLPYSHILANPAFGTLVSDKALGFTWALNARENKLTPWYNDVATDNDGELLLVKVGGKCYNLIDGSAPVFTPKSARYTSRFGPSLEATVTVSVPETGTVKVLDLTLENRGTEPVTLHAAYYLEPVLGVNRDSCRLITASYEGGDLLLHNPYNTAVPCYGVLSSDAPEQWPVCGRRDFLTGQWEAQSLPPNADPCASLVLPITLPPQGRRGVRFRLAYGASAEAARKMAHLEPLPAGRQPNRYLLRTPDRALNHFTNTFAPHQIAAGRLWGRTGFYQCGGAYGFRDQLQDVCAYRIIDPAVAKVQIYRCCAVQFLEGDVLHWWHRFPKGQFGLWLTGVRTRYSDDLLWLPFAVADYLAQTDDAAILSVNIPYLEGEPLAEGEHERYFAPAVSAEKGTVYDHCLRALDHAARMGDRGLPLMGCGDWNDGYNRVGAGGSGESVWLAMFLAWVAEKFVPVAARMEDSDRMAQLLALAQQMREAVDATAWDGQWYLRAFYDDGSPMGSHEQDACQIDLLPQSFAVFAGMPDRQRVDAALKSAMHRLVDEEHGIVSLFTPAFDRSPQNPGYVKAYPPGIRENGGQYTHSAVWFAMALLRWGRRDEGYRILSMLSPIAHSENPARAARYKTEPYYMAADVYTNPAALGHGGWSIYTGAVSWFYRTVLEELLGLQIRGNELHLHPRLPSQWQGRDCSVDCIIQNTHRQETHLTIRFVLGEEERLLCDGQAARVVPLDGGNHQVEVFTKCSEA